MSTEFDDVSGIDDLPEHPSGRAWPGYNPNARDYLKDAVETIGEYGRYGELRGILVVASGTAHIYSEDYGVATRSAVDKFSDGDLRSAVPNQPREIDEPDEDKLIREFYYEDDDDWPAFEVNLVGARRFYLWARDSAQAAEVGLSNVDPGDYGSCAYVTDWSAEPAEVDVDRLAVQTGGLETMLEEVED